MSTQTAPATQSGQLRWEPSPDSARAAMWTRGAIGNANTMMTRKREKLEMPVCARVSASKFRTLEIWCDNSFRKRSEVVGMVLDRVLDILEQQESIEQPVEEFVRRLRADRTE